MKFHCALCCRNTLSSKRRFARASQLWRLSDLRGIQLKKTNFWEGETLIFASPVTTIFAVNGKRIFINVSLNLLVWDKIFVSTFREKVPPPSSQWTNRFVWMMTWVTGEKSLDFVGSVSYNGGRDTLFGVRTRYRLAGSEFELRWAQDTFFFSTSFHTDTGAHI